MAACRGAGSVDSLARHENPREGITRLDDRHAVYENSTMSRESALEAPSGETDLKHRGKLVLRGLGQASGLRASRRYGRKLGGRLGTEKKQLNGPTPATDTESGLMHVTPLKTGSSPAPATDASISEPGTIPPHEHVTPILKTMNCRVGSSGGEAEAASADSLTAALATQPPAEVTDNVVDEEPRVVNLGDLENRIEVGALSRFGFELILEICPVINF